jgi:ABC-type nitrate/sulfonate/bicarbonate transport system permease component
VWSALGMGASKGDVFRRVVLPSALPMIFASLRVSLALSFIVMFAAEMINARSGLGHMIRIAENSLRFDLMYVSLVAIAILGYAGDRLVRLAHSRLLAWQQPA